MACAHAAGLSRLPVALICESEWLDQEHDAVKRHQINEHPLVLMVAP